MKTCCEWMQNMIANAGQKGLSVVLSRELGERRFLAQARPLTRRQEQILGAAEAAGVPRSWIRELYSSESGGAEGISLMMQVPLAHCPGCGTGLTRWASRHEEEFDRLAEVHRGLAPGLFD
jgi:hypothetical protein